MKVFLFYDMTRDIASPILNSKTMRASVEPVTIWVTLLAIIVVNITNGLGSKDRYEIR
ncbi:MAG TPA: hypothetical protein VE573_11755 [Nitrososphaeraceae archaeon]|nr:hypothetical protein [Nitrososphaeraceae archaeon]